MTLAPPFYRFLYAGTDVSVNVHFRILEILAESLRAGASATSAAQTWINCRFKMLACPPAVHSPQGPGFVAVGKRYSIKLYALLQQVLFCLDCPDSPHFSRTPPAPSSALPFPAERRPSLRYLPGCSSLFTCANASSV